MVTLEVLLDKISDELILNGIVTPDVVSDNQKTIRNGTLQLGRTDDDRLVLYQKDVKANQQDLLITETLETPDGEQTIISTLQNIANGIEDINLVTISINQLSPDGYSVSIFDGNEEHPVDFLIDTENNNPLNVSQFVSIKNESSVIDVDKANEFLDTNIYELLPTGDTRQARITRFFQELNALLPTNEPEFDEDGISGVDRDAGGNWIGSEQYSQDNSISYAQNNTDGNIDEEDAFIHRLKLGAVPANDTNSTKTIEDIYNRIEPYLKDILEAPATLEDDRPEYRNQSSGYLKFRNLNQGIIIRNTNQDFIEGLDPSNPTYLDTLDDDGAVVTGGTGFTITMWVRFLDKVSQGTLFNFGNPTRAENPFGFKLETYVVNKEDPAYFNNSLGNFGDYVDAESYFNDTLGLFQNTNTERFVRLQVREYGQDNANQDYDLGFRSSEIGNPTLSKFTWNAPELDKLNPTAADLRLLNNANIPENFNEWYFICASYNPSIIEPVSADYPDVNIAENSDYWLNHLTNDNIYVSNSGLGNKCKVEIISRSDLLRARGFKVD